MSWGEIYNTSWWGVALDTARTVKARPDFFGSQLNLLTSEQPNLVTNGTFDTDSGWIKGTGWSISGGKAILVDGLDPSYQIYQSISGLNTKNLKVTFDVTDFSGDAELRYPFRKNITGNGSYTFYGVGTLDRVQFQVKSGFTASFSIDNVSVQLVRAELDQIEAKKCLADWIHTTALKDLNN